MWDEFVSQKGSDSLMGHELSLLLVGGLSKEIYKILEAEVPNIWQ